MDINFENLRAKAIIEYLELDKYIYIMQVKDKKNEKEQFIKNTKVSMI